MKIRAARRSYGYSIVEVMIFLAVTGLLFVSAMLLVGGRQGKVQFTQGLQALDARLNDVINDVASGYYPSPGSFNCQVSTPLDPTVSPSLSTVGGGGQGTREECVFLGKIIQLQTDTTTNESTIHVYTAIGRRRTPDGSGSFRLATTLYEAQPIAGEQGGVNLTETFKVAWGVHVYNMVYSTDPTNYSSPTSTAGVGFLSSLGQYSGNDLQSGAQQIGILSLKLTDLTTPKATFIAKVDCPDVSCATNFEFGPSLGVMLCVQDVSGKQKAAIEIGARNRKLATEVKIGNRNTTVCP